MKKISPLFVSGITIAILCIVGTTSFARSHLRRGDSSNANVLGLCWTDSDSATSSADYGIVFSLEPANGNEIAADIYSLDSNRQRIKQIGHADVTSAASDNGDVTFTSASDSPTQFSLTITKQDNLTSDNPSGDNSSENFSENSPGNQVSITGELVTAVLFDGQAAANIALKCRAHG